LLRLPDLTDEDHQDCWQLAQEQTLRKSEKARKGRDDETIMDETYRGLTCERSLFRSMGEDMYLECVARQEVPHASYGSDGGDIDVKSAEMKSPSYEYRLAVAYDNLKRDQETKRYFLVIRQFVKGKGFVFWSAGWATKEEILNSTNELFYGKPNLTVSQLHSPDA